MDFETLGTLATETIKDTLEELKKIMKHKDTKTEEKIVAAKVIDSMTDTLIKAFLLSADSETSEKVVNKLTSQLDKLTRE